MAVDSKISELAQTVSLAGGDWLTILDQSALPPDGDNRKILASDVRDFMSYISQGQATDLTDAGDSTLHYHQADRENAAETLTFAGTDPQIDAASTTSGLFLSLLGNPSFGFYRSIGGYNIINFRLIEAPKALTSLTYAAPDVTATTTIAHGFPVGITQSIVISGASPAEYNGTYDVAYTGTNTFTYTPGSPPGSSPADPPGTWNHLPTCLIIGEGVPSGYPGLIDAVAFGSVFLDILKEDITGSHMYSKGEGGAPGYAIVWRSISSS